MLTKLTLLLITVPLLSLAQTGAFVQKVACIGPNTGATIAFTGVAGSGNCAQLSALTTGQVIVAAVTYSQSGATRTVTPPAGTTWTAVTGFPLTNGVISLGVYTHVVAGGDPTAYTWTIGTTSGNDYSSATMTTYSGVNTTTPINAATALAVTPSTTSFVATTATPTVNGTLAILAIATSGGSVGGIDFGSAPVGWTKDGSSRPNYRSTFIFHQNSLGSTGTAVNVTATTYSAGDIGVEGLILLAPVVPPLGNLTLSGCISVAESGTCVMTANKSVTWALAGGGSISGTTGSSVTFTAPASVSGGIVRSGCPVYPVDSIFNTPINSMPVNAKNAVWSANMWSTEPSNYWKWDGGGGAWGQTIIDSSTPMLTMILPWNGPNPWPVPNPAIVLRENGRFATNEFSQDASQEYINKQTCDIYEQYGGNTTVNKSEKGRVWNAGVTSTTPYFLTGGASSVAGIPYIPLIPTVEDIKYGFNHPMDFAWLNIPPGTPGFPGMFTNGYSWPATYTNDQSQTGYSSPPTDTLPGPGSWARLSTAWCTANLASYSGYVRNILNQGCNYGWILTDWTRGSAFGGHMDESVWQDPVAHTAMVTAEGVIGTAWAASRSNVEWIDVSSLSTCTPWWNCLTAAVNPSNGHVTIPYYSRVTVTNAGIDNPASSSINVVPPTIGTLHPYLVIPAGSANYQLTWYVNGTANQTVTWTGTGVSSTGLFTVPASIAVITNYDLVGASAADSNSTIHVNIYVIPSNADGSVRYDIGSSTAVYNDGTNKWMSDLFLPQIASAVSSDLTYTSSNWPAGIADRNIWLTETQEIYGSGDLDYGDIVLPAGNYNVTWMANASTAGSTTTLYSDNWNGANGSFDYGPVALTANYQMDGIVAFGLLNTTNGPYMNNTDQRITVPAIVGADRILRVTMSAVILHSANGLGGNPAVGNPCTPCIGFRHTPVAQGMYITPYVGTAQWVVFNQYPVVSVGATVQNYLQDWGTGAGSKIGFTTAFPEQFINLSTDTAGDAVWSVTGSAGGTIGAASGLYTAPSFLATDAYDIIKVSNGTYSATKQIMVLGNSHLTAIH